jgi:hypothetical protein
LFLLLRSETMISDCPTDQAYDACQIKINRKGKVLSMKGA